MGGAGDAEGSTSEERWEERSTSTCRNVDPGSWRSKTGCVHCEARFGVLTAVVSESRRSFLSLLSAQLTSHLESNGVESSTGVEETQEWM